jgi:AI-2 transport protein TqsA
MIQIPLNSGARVGFNVVLILAGVVALRWGQPVFIPTIIALLMASVLGPAANWLHRVFKIRWSLSCLLVIVGLILANAGLMLVFALASARMVQQVPTTETEIIKVYNGFREKLENFWPWPLDEELFPRNPTEVSQIRAYQYLTEAVPRALPVIAEYSGSWVWQWILIMFILLFLLLEGRMLTRRVVEIFGPSEEVKNKTLAVLEDMAHSVRTYLVWRTIINFGLAIIVGLVYQFAGLKQAWTWAVLLAILNYIPYLGPLIAGIPPFIDALFSTTPLGAFIIMVIYWVVIILEGYLIVPLLMGRSMDLNATTVMLACLFWELVWGMMGLFLAMPIMAGVKAICFHVPGWRPWANLMSADDTDTGPPSSRLEMSLPPIDANGQVAPLPAEPAKAST